MDSSVGVGVGVGVRVFLTGTVAFRSIWIPREGRKAITIAAVASLVDRLLPATTTAPKGATLRLARFLFRENFRPCNAFVFPEPLQLVRVQNMRYRALDFPRGAVVLGHGELDHDVGAALNPKALAELGRKEAQTLDKAFVVVVPLGLATSTRGFHLHYVRPVKLHHSSKGVVLVHLRNLHHLLLQVLPPTHLLPLCSSCWVLLLGWLQPSIPSRPALRTPNRSTEVSTERP
mmetsp:Transcript_9234/g.26261  ORF Transcript_9234/g.26261 Transcript_9234/m.26261 type:complete len:232 (+) Transcript_9234:131-826(+)